MPTAAFLHSLVELAGCESLETLLDDGVAALERELALRARVEIWDAERTLFARGEVCSAEFGRTWIGSSYTLGAIQLQSAPDDRAAVELLALQLAPLAERLLERELSRGCTIREDIARLYERRILDALVRSDWNASAVARDLRVSRSRVAAVIRKWRGDRPAVPGRNIYSEADVPRQGI